MLEEEITQIAEEVADRKISEIPPIEIPPIEFPEVQKVEVVNQVEPVINVAAPIVNVPEPKVTVNVPTPQVIVEAQKISIPDNTKLLEDIKRILEKSDEDNYAEKFSEIGERTVKAIKDIKIYGPAIGSQPLLIDGQLDNGSRKTISATQEGHLEVAIHSPRLPFGSVHFEKLSPVFNSDAVYGLNSAEVVSTTGLSVGTGANSGSATGSNNLFKAFTGTTQYSFATIQSRRRLRYRAGQGVVGRFAGFFSTPAASSIVVAGVGTAESGFYFGYNGTSFGVLYSTGGVREIHTLTITTASTATNNYVVTLPNTATVNVTATNVGTTQGTAYEISRGTFPGWKAEARGSTVVFIANSVGPVSGTFSLSQPSAGTPAAGTDVETVAGVAGTDTWVSQSSWNGDKLDGTGTSGVTLDPSKGNIYQIGIQYLGFGSVKMEIEVCTNNANNPEFITVHTFKFPNTLTSVHSTQPSYPFTMAAYSSGSTTNVGVSVGSFAGFIEGDIVYIGPRASFYNNSGVSSSTSAYVPIFTIRNDYVYASRANQSVDHILSVHGATKSNTGLTTFYLIRNAALEGSPNFTQFGSQSSTYWDTASTGCTFTDNAQVVWSGSVSESGDFNYAFSDNEITLQPGETLTLAVRSVTATATCVGSLNLREDQ